MGRATVTYPADGKRYHNFNPRPPWGGRLEELPGYSVSNKFQSTPSVGRATPIPAIKQQSYRFQSTPSVGRATGHFRKHQQCQSISIHALRGEGDHSPCLISCTSAVFQSTPSVGRATCLRPAFRRLLLHFNPRPPWGGRQRPNGEARRGGDNFNPRPPWGGRPPLRRLWECSNAISIHALRGEGDLINAGAFTLKNISIHALRGEGDKKLRRR